MAQILLVSKTLLKTCRVIIDTLAPPLPLTPQIPIWLFVPHGLLSNERSRVHSLESRRSLLPLSALWGLRPREEWGFPGLHSLVWNPGLRAPAPSGQSLLFLHTAPCLLMAERPRRGMDGPCPLTAPHPSHVSSTQ